MGMPPCLISCLQDPQTHETYMEHISSPIQNNTVFLNGCHFAGKQSRDLLVEQIYGKGTPSQADTCSGVPHIGVLI